MTLLIPIILLLLTAVISVLLQISTLKNSKSEGTQLDSDHKINSRINRFVIVCMILCLMLSSWQLAHESEEKSDFSSLQQQRFDTTVIKLNTTITQSTLLIDSLREIKTRVLLIEDSMKQELRTQREISSMTTDILEKNRSLLVSQEEIYKNTNRVAFPLFPLTLAVEFTMPFNSPGIQTLVKYLSQFRNDIELSPTQYSRYINAWSFQNGKLNRLVFNYAEIQDPALSFDTLLHPSFHISLVKGPLKEFKAHKSIPQMHFTVSRHEDRDVKLVINFGDSALTVLVTYRNCLFRANEDFISNTFFGSNELLGSYVLANVYTTHGNDVILKTLKFFPNDGHLEKLFIRFAKEDTFSLWHYDKIHFHKITRRNFQYWDEDNQ